MKIAYDKNWISTRDGNASFRRKGEDVIYVTPSGVRKQHLNAEMIIKLAVQGDGTLTRVDDETQRRISGLEPTGELALHQLLQSNVPQNRVVLHLHPTYIVAAMYAGFTLQHLAAEFPEINRYTRVGPNVGILPPTTEELAHASIKAFNLNPQTGTVDYDIIGLDRHGVVVVAPDALTALEHIERLEHVCKIALTGRVYQVLP